MDRVAKIFNGTYSISSPTGEHRTFDISTQPENAEFAPGKRIIALLTGPNNNADYKSFGFVTDNGINVYKKLRGTDEPSHFDWYAHLVWKLATTNDSRWHKLGYKLMVEGTCLKCNRKLTTPESLKIGLGPICAKGGWDHGPEKRIKYQQ